jgi:Domain of unknown function (DUF4124)
MPMMFSSLVVLAALAVGSQAQAQGVYRSIDESGRVIYSDRPAGKKSEAVRSATPANPSRFEYESAVMRAESERIHMQRLEAENSQPRPFTVYDPRGLQRPPYAPQRYPAINIRLDPNLPDSPPPSLDRTYLYNGR